MATEKKAEKKKKAKKKKQVNSRAKGKRNELLLAHMLQEYGFDARRSQQFAGINGDADVVGVPFLHVECKAVQKLNLDKAMEQSIRDAREGEIPIVAHHKDKKPWRVTIAFDDFMPMYVAWERMMTIENERTHNTGTSIQTGATSRNKGDDGQTKDKGMG